MAIPTVDARIAFATAVNAGRADDLHMSVRNVAEKRVNREIGPAVFPTAGDPVIRDPMHAMGPLHVFPDRFAVCPHDFLTPVPFAQVEIFDDAAAEMKYLFLTICINGDHRNSRFFLSLGGTLGFSWFLPDHYTTNNPVRRRAYS